ncbi:hypothetical protein Barb7_00722 [Bacteroidales bacterium Barb7]|nr:hypothetical protein Barb7_00722 [Bacteroidales bacterium Barb7]
MAQFSERYGYVQPSAVLIREKLTDELQNAICTAYDSLAFQEGFVYTSMEKHLWCYFLNKRLADFENRWGTPNVVVVSFLYDSTREWYKKLDMIEATIDYLKNKAHGCYSSLVEYLNHEFKRLNFAYRIVNDQIVEVTSEEEILTIESALNNSSDSVKEHFQTALELLSKRPDGDYRNSIKESISAVEAFTREITGEKTLNFKKMESKGITIPPVLRKSFESLYGYTNDSSVGARHPLLENSNVPDADEAIFMLVACSAFINYLTKKRSRE